MRTIKSCLILSWILAVTLSSIVQAMVDPCQISNLTVWIGKRPAVTKYNCNGNVKINATDLRDAPDIQFTAPGQMSDRFTLMMLKYKPNAPALFDVHWFIANISPDRDLFLTKNKTNATQFFVYKRPTPGDFQILVFKQNTSGAIPQGPGFTSDNLFSVNKWMDNNAKTITVLIGGAKFQVVNGTGAGGRPSSPASPSLYPPVPVLPGGFHPPQSQPPVMNSPSQQYPQQPTYNPQYHPPTPVNQGAPSPQQYPQQPSYNPQYHPPTPVNQGAPSQQYPHPQPVPSYNHPQTGVQNNTHVVHHYHKHETVKKKKKNSSPSMSFSLSLLGISAMVALL